MERGWRGSEGCEVSKQSIRWQRGEARRDEARRGGSRCLPSPSAVARPRGARASALPAGELAAAISEHRRVLWELWRAPRLARRTDVEVRAHRPPRHGHGTQCHTMGMPCQQVMPWHPSLGTAMAHSAATAAHQRVVPLRLGGHKCGLCNLPCAVALCGGRCPRLRSTATRGVRM